MALPSSYLTSTKNLAAFLDSIRSAQAPEKFTLAFLESLDFKSSSDRLFISVLKTLGFLDDTGKPTDRYFRYLDKSQSQSVLAEGIREAYGDLFRVNINAQSLSRADLINKLKTLSQGKLGESVLDKMAMTISGLAKHADFSSSSRSVKQDEEAPAETEEPSDDSDHETPRHNSQKRGYGRGLAIGGLVYNIQIVLPESRDPAVYDALFQSLRKHLG